MPLKATLKALLFHAMVTALSGLKLENALLVKSAPGPLVTLKKIVATPRQPARAKERKGRIVRRPLHLQGSAVAHRTKTRSAVLPFQKVVESLVLLLPANEVSLLLVKLTSLLALDT